MTSDKLTAGRAMLREGATITTAARVIGVSRATLYRHLEQRASGPVTASVVRDEGLS
jgi:transposase-like protein